jgi:hypothetical protein
MKVSVKVKYTNELRLTILENSLLHEYLITRSLGDILEIDLDNSYCLSDKSSSLTLATKINLLIDLNRLTKEQRTKLFYYLEIRNKFLHNWKCRTFEDCFSGTLSQTYKGLVKLYKPDMTLTQERQMNFCYNALSDDIVDIAINHLTMNVIDTKVTREKNKRDLAKYGQLRDNLVKVFWETLDSKILADYKISKENQIKLLEEFMSKVM